MSETQSTLFKQRVSGLLIAGAFLLLLSVLFGLRSSTPFDTVGATLQK